MKRLTNEEQNILLKNADLSSYALSDETGIPASTIRAFWKRHGINKKNIFNPDKDEFIKKYDELKSSRKVAKYYNVEHTTILNYARKIGYDNSIDMLLNDDDVRYILSRYEYNSASELAIMFNVSTSLISAIWNKNGLNGKENRVYHLYNQKLF